MATLDPDSEKFGTDLALLDELNPVWGLVSGKVNVGYALCRRFRTVRGSKRLSNGYMANYGLYLPGLVEQKFRGQDVSGLEDEIKAECLKDPRVQDATATVTFSFATRTMTVKIMVTTADGSFDLVMLATSLTVEILSIDGVQPTTLTATQIADLAGINVVVFRGEKGDKGDSGTGGGGGGGGGGAQATLDFGDSLMNSNDGNENVVFEDTVRFGDLPGALTAAISASLRSSLGTATYKVRVGGTSGAADGTVALTIARVPTGFAAVTSSAPFTNPTGTLPVKVTAQSSANGQDAEIKGVVVTFR